jgi:hypothetical protein
VGVALSDLLTIIAILLAGGFLFTVVFLVVMAMIVAMDD